MKPIEWEALEGAATLFRALRLDNGVGQLLGVPEQKIYRAVENKVNEALGSCGYTKHSAAEGDEMEKKIEIFNASGHPIHQEDVRVVDDYRIPNVDLEDPGSVAELAVDIAKRFLPYAALGIPIALPGMSVLAAHTLAAIHGLSGFWPVVIWAVQVDGAFVWRNLHSADLHALRTRMRGERWA